MDFKLRLFLAAGIIFYLLLILRFLKRKELNLKYTLLWLLTAAVMLLVVLFPGMIGWAAHAVGIIEPVNFVFVIEGLFVLLLLLSLTVIVSHTTDRIYRLTQSQAIVEKRVRELEKALDALKDSDGAKGET